MKSVLMSIRPKWCELIASGKKTIEVRKTKPKLDVPFKVYIYCTKDKSKEIRYEKPDGAISDNGKHYSLFSTGKVIGEFVCDEIHTGKAETRKEAVCLYYDIEEQSCLSKFEFANCWNGKDLYAWHISNLIIYDKPKELREFYSICLGWDKERFTKKCDKCNHFARSDEDMCYVCDIEGEKPIISPPQSYCYCEEVSI